MDLLVVVVSSSTTTTTTGFRMNWKAQLNSDLTLRGLFSRIDEKLIRRDFRAYKISRIFAQDLDLREIARK